MQKGKDNTWLEEEELCYPTGNMLRRCRAKHRDTGKLVTVKCGVPDTYFSIPCRGGFLTIDDGVFIFNPSKKRGQEKCISK